jgi:hypothetical protein
MEEGKDDRGKKRHNRLARKSNGVGSNDETWGRSDDGNEEGALTVPLGKKYPPRSTERGSFTQRAKLRSIIIN